MFIIRCGTRGLTFLRRKSVNNLTYSILSNAFDASNNNKKKSVLLLLWYNSIVSINNWVQLIVLNTYLCSS